MAMFSGRARELQQLVEEREREIKELRARIEEYRA